MTNKPLNEIEDNTYKYPYGNPKPKDEREFVKNHGKQVHDAPKEDGLDVFAHIKNIKKDKSRKADQENQGTTESAISRIRGKAVRLSEASTSQSDVPSPAASDNPQSGQMTVEPEPKPDQTDPLGQIKEQLKNIALAAADIYDGISENTKLDQWMIQTVVKADGEFGKIIEQFKKNNSGTAVKEEKEPEYVYKEKMKKAPIKPNKTIPLVMDMDSPGNENSATHDAPSNESPNPSTLRKKFPKPSKPASV